MEMAPLTELLFLALADITHKNNLCNRTWGGLSNVCTKSERAKSEAPFTRCRYDLKTAPLTWYRHDSVTDDKCSYDAG